MAKSRLILRRDSEWQQWIVKVYDRDGKRNPGADYFTDDKQDAIQTMAYMQTEIDREK